MEPIVLGIILGALIIGPSSGKGKESSKPETDQPKVETVVSAEKHGDFN